MIKNLLDNWKTTSAGLSSITTGVVRISLAIKHGTADESAWTGCIGLIIVGIGLLAAGDSAKSKQDLKDVDAKVNQTAAAVLTGDTGFLPKSAADTVAACTPPTTPPKP